MTSFLRRLGLAFDAAVVLVASLVTIFGPLTWRTGAGLIAAFVVVRLAASRQSGPLLTRLLPQELLWTLPFLSAVVAAVPAVVLAFVAVDQLRSRPYMLAAVVIVCTMSVLASLYALRELIRHAVYLDSASDYLSELLRRARAQETETARRVALHGLVEALNRALTRVKRLLVPLDQVLVVTALYVPDFERNALVLESVDANNPTVAKDLREKAPSVPLLRKADGFLHAEPASCAAHVFLHAPMMDSREFARAGAIRKRIMRRGPGMPWENELKAILPPDDAKLFAPQEFVALPVGLDSRTLEVRSAVIGSFCSDEGFYSEHHLRHMHAAAVAASAVHTRGLSLLERRVTADAVRICRDALVSSSGACEPAIAELRKRGELLRLWRKSFRGTDWSPVVRLLNDGGAWQPTGWETSARFAELARAFDLAREIGRVIDLDYALWIKHMQAMGGETPGVAGKILYFKMEPESAMSPEAIDLMARCPYLQKVRASGATVCGTIVAPALDYFGDLEKTRSILESLETVGVRFAVDVRSAEELGLLEAAMPPERQFCVRIRGSLWQAPDFNLSALRHRFPGATPVARDVQTERDLARAVQQQFAIIEGPLVKSRQAAA